MEEGADIRSVSRAELYPGSESSELHEDDRAVEESLQERYRQDYLSSAVDVTFDEGLERATNETDPGDEGERGQEGVEIFAFRLFSRSASKPSGSANNGNTPSRIDIRSPSPPVGEPGFIHPRRPDSYYFTGEADRVTMERFHASAVCGQDVLAELQRRWRGNELPWRVITWRTTGAPVAWKQNLSTAKGSGGGKRAGKKKRIATRKKMALIQSQRTQATLSQQKKQAANREKRTRRNREKKVKKKERDKSKKRAKSLDGKQDCSTSHSGRVIDRFTLMS
ncbi:MAG: hypothetical protein Q9187_007348 [Circinaria calcarea]